MSQIFTCTPIPGGLVLAGRFDMSALATFRSATRKLLGSNVQSLELNMKSVDYLDSSALGMLLNLHLEAEQHRQKIKLSDCQPYVRKVLATACFDQFFAVTSG